MPNNLFLPTNWILTFDLEDIRNVGLDVSCFQIGSKPIFPSRPILISLLKRWVHKMYIRLISYDKNMGYGFAIRTISMFCSPIKSGGLPVQMICASKDILGSISRCLCVHRKMLWSWYVTNPKNSPMSFRAFRKVARQISRWPLPRLIDQKMTNLQSHPLYIAQISAFDALWQHL